MIEGCSGDIPHTLPTNSDEINRSNIPVLELSGDPHPLQDSSVSQEKSDDSDSVTPYFLVPPESDNPSTVPPTDRKHVFDPQEKASRRPHNFEADLNYPTQSAVYQPFNTTPSVESKSDLKLIHSLLSGPKKKKGMESVMFHEDSPEMMMTLLSPAIKPFRSVFPEDVYKQEVQGDSGSGCGWIVRGGKYFVYLPSKVAPDWKSLMTW